MKKIALFVTLAHLLMIFSLLFSPAKKNPHPTKHIAVRTIQNRPKAQSRIQMGSSPVASAGASARTQGSASLARSSSPKAPSTKPQTAKPKSSTKESTKPPAPSSPSSNNTSNKKPSHVKKPAVVEKNKKAKPKAAPLPEVFKEIDEALAKIDEKGYSKPRLKLDVPQIQDSSEIALPFPAEGGGFGEPMGPEETLVSYLHSSLNLPEFGEVKIQVTVNKEGSIEKLVVLHAESKKNKAYLEQHLPLLKLPITLEKEKTFTLTFCNEI